MMMRKGKVQRLKMARREWTEWTEYDEGSVGYDHNNTALSLDIHTLSTLVCDLENKIEIDI